MPIHPRYVGALVLTPQGLVLDPEPLPELRAEFELALVFLHGSPAHPWHAGIPVSSGSSSLAAGALDAVVQGLRERTDPGTVPRAILTVASGGHCTGLMGAAHLTAMSQPGTTTPDASPLSRVLNVDWVAAREHGVWHGPVGDPTVALQQQAVTQRREWAAVLGGLTLN